MTVKMRYTKEFKLDAISLVLDQGYTATEVSMHQPCMVLHSAVLVWQAAPRTDFSRRGEVPCS